MRRNMSSRLTMAAVVVAGSWAAMDARAASFAPAQVANDAKWVVHYDVDASRETAYGKKFHEEHVATEKGQEKLKWVKDRYGIDLEKDLHGFTAYGSSYEPHSGVLLIQARFDRAKVEKVIQDEADYRTSKHGDHTIHSWTAKHRGHHGHRHADADDDDAKKKDAKKKASGRTVAAAFVKNRVAVLAGSEQAVKAALDVLDGKSKNLKGADSPLVFDVPKGTFFQGAAVELSGLKGRHRPFAVLQQSKSARMTFGESGGKTSFAFDLDIGDADTAKQVVKMAEGFQAMLALQAKAKPALAPITKGLAVEQADGKIDVDWNVSTDAVLKLAEKMKARHEKRKHDDD